jgi:hypothetical protein
LTDDRKARVAEPPRTRDGESAVVEDDFFRLAHRRSSDRHFCGARKYALRLEEKITHILIFGKNLREAGAKGLDSLGFLRAGRMRRTRPATRRRRWRGSSGGGL